MTDTIEGNCGSYEISLAAVDALGGGPAALGGPPAIAVGAHYAAPPPISEQVTSPSIFVFNPVHGNWTEAKPYRPTAGEPNRAYATLKEQSQRIIVGIIATPQNSSATPTKLSESDLSKPIDDVQPTSGYLSIDQVEADSKGAFQVSLPLLLRPSRGSGPSFSIAYDPHGHPGVLGRGWDLRLSSITVRGPSPLYHPSFETEDYLLDGSDLIALDAKGKDLPPLYKGGPIVPRVPNIRCFHLRNDTTGLIVKRYGDTPDTYYWEIWNPHSFVIRLYGAYPAHPIPIRKPDGLGPIPIRAPDGDGLFRGVALYSGGVERRAIGEWGLTEEYDNQPAHSGARYSYFQVDHPKDGDPGRDCMGYGRVSCYSALRLHYATYNLAFGETNDGEDLAGATTVEFSWRPRDTKRSNSDGRLGYLKAYEYWLTAITVTYKPDANARWLVTDRNGYRARFKLDTGDDKLFDSVNFAVPGGHTLFSQHTFEPFFSEDIEAHADCANSDVLLASYSVTANPLYDLAKDLVSQKFAFKYKGGRPDDHGNCAPEQWPSETLSAFGNAPSAAPSGLFPFPKGLLDGLGFGLLTRTSLLGTSESTETGASLYVGVGPDDGNVFSKSNTGGFKGGVDFSQSDGTSTLVDITGSGIPAMVYRDGGHLAYCSGVREPGVKESPDVSGILHRTRYYGERCGTIDGVDTFSFSTSSNQSSGAEGYIGSNVFAGVSFSQSQNQTFTYFADVDGDGLIDIVDHGQVYYNQGEVIEGGHRIVRFTPNSALRPPIPGRSKSSGGQGVLPAVSTTHIPQDLRDTVEAIETQLDTVASRLRDLEFSQITIAWEAPLDGVVAISGQFQRGVSGVETGNEGALGDFGPVQFDTLYQQSQLYQAYVKSKLNCSIWPEDQHCYDEVANPFQAHFKPSPKDISFLAAPQSLVQIFLSRLAQPTTTSCSNPVTHITGLDLSSIPITAVCQNNNAGSNSINVKTGDVIYVTYNIHPSLQSFVLPSVKFSYQSVDDDAVFNVVQQAGANALPSQFTCRFADEIASTGNVGCLLSKQTRYEFNLSEGLIASSPAAQVRIPKGSERQIGGILRLPTALAADYQIYFDVVGAPAPADSSSAPTPPPAPGQDTRYSDSMPTARLPILFRQDVSAACPAGAAECSVSISVNCATTAPDCAAFLAHGLQGSAYYLASRLTFEHKGVPRPIAVQGITNRLASVVWLEPPYIASLTTELPPRAGAAGPITPAQTKEPSVYYLPVSMGEPDRNYVRIEKGTFANPDRELEEGLHGAETISFERMLADERETVNLARLRQTHHLCLMGSELIGFLSDRAIDHTSPYVDDYDTYWTERFAAYKTRCDKAEYDIGRFGFINGEKPEKLSDNSLDLVHLLRDLPNVEQRTSAETLLERVLTNLQLDEEFLTDSPRVTRRGYRLPAKVNPLDCYRTDGGSETAWSDQPLTRPIFGPESDCSYRLATNFAMQDVSEFRNILSPSQIANIRKVAAKFGPDPAFKIELTATVNGEPVAFQELTGADSGNETCPDLLPGPADLRTTCIGSYGTIGPDNYRYPNAGGDLFQRLTLNKRIGRAVGFGNSIMDVGQGIFAICGRDYPAYDDLHSMELKQDCLPPNSHINPGMKYISGVSYSIEYTIGENNEFHGRNRVLEFRASPLDILEFHYHLMPVERDVAGVRDHETISGKFSILGATNPISLQLGVASGHYMIPRSPSQILSNAPITADEFACDAAPDGRLTSGCRPWTRLGWTEVIFGTQYRTYSDAQATGIGHTFSVERRRENLRLSPEIEVDAREYQLVDTTTKSVPLVEDQPKQADHQFWVFEENGPYVSKLGGAWAFFAARSGQNQLATPFTFPALRYDRTLLPRQDRGDIGSYDTSYKACGTVDHPNVDDCQDNLGTTGQDMLALRNVNVFPLEHRFVGPTTFANLKKFEDSASLIILPPTGRCAAEFVTATASCWIGADDTIFFEAAVSPATPAMVRPDARSVSALVGFERPPIAEYRSLFTSYVKLVCLDGAGPAGQCQPQNVSAPAAVNQFSYPNRPLPPDPARQIPTYAPVLASETRSVAFNAGIGPVNTSSVTSDKHTTVQFLDLTGTGFPSAVSNGVAALMSPVGLSRSDWWRYYRSSDGRADLSAESVGVGADQSAHSTSKGVGAGLSPSTAALFRDRATQTRDFRIVGRQRRTWLRLQYGERPRRHLYSDDRSQRRRSAGQGIRNEDRKRPHCHI